MNFLRRIEHASFPLAINEESAIQCAAVLVAAQLIEANLPEPGAPSEKRGVVLRITLMGRAALKRFNERGESAVDLLGT